MTSPSIEILDPTIPAEKLPKIAATLIRVLADHFGVNESQIKSNLNDTFHGLNADELDLVEIVIEVEEAFEIEISDDSSSFLTNDTKISEYITAFANLWQADTSPHKTKF